MTTRKSKGFSGARLEKMLLGRPLSLGQALTGLRELHGLSQTALARMSGLSKQHVCDIEKGRRFVSPVKAAALARKLGHPESYFVRLALQDSINQGGLKYKVLLEAA
ncbi:MAG: helix-turn-helix transcriptional regulator [Rhodospirillaceae bacterium]|nr:helix-turn-helix transcriptional regulator [Rhodospirillaceae bacterium]